MNQSDQLFKALEMVNELNKELEIIKLENKLLKEKLIKFVNGSEIKVVDSKTNIRGQGFYIDFNDI